MVAATSSGRTAVFRSALLFTPFTLVALAILGFLAKDVAVEGVSAGLVVALVLVGFVTLLLVYQVVQSVRDLFAQPVETTGVVDRRWSRNDMLIFRNDYIFVEGDVFRIEPEHTSDIEVGRKVRITHYPHTNAVIDVEVLPMSQPESAHA